MVSTSVSRHHHHECGVGGAVREGCCTCARCACPPEQRTQQRVRRRTGAGRTQASYSNSYSYTGPVPSVAVKEWTRMRAIVGLADVGGERAQMVVSSWHGVRPDLCAKPAKTGAFVPSKFVCAAGGRDRREPISSCKLYCLSVLDYRTSSCGLGGKSGLPPAVQKATATAPWTLSTLERKGTRHHTCALRSPARESAYRHYVICTYVMTTLRPGQRRTLSCTCSPSRCSTVYLNCSVFIPSTLHCTQLVGLQSAAPRPTSRGGLLFHGTHWLPDLRGNRGAEAALTR
jgi:hypothetical protein